LADVLGKDIAERIMKNDRQQIEGEGLAIGGAGMVGYYDKIVPSVANDVLRKLGGGKVGEVDLGGNGRREPPAGWSVNREDDGTYTITDDNGEHMLGYESRAEALRAIENDAGLSTAAKPATQPGFDITPAMRAKASKPLSPFKQEGKVDPELLKMLGLAGLGAAGAYVLTGDRDKAIAAAIAMGSLPLAHRMLRKVGESVGNAAEILSDKRINPKQVWRDFAAGVRVPEYLFKQWQKSAEAILPVRGKERAAAYTRIRDYAQGYRDVPLSPHELAAATELRKFLDNIHDIGTKGDALHSYLENYLPGLYQKMPFASWTDIINRLMQEESRLSNVPGMRQSTRHAMEKIIPDYRTVDRLIAEGKLDLIPLTNNPFEMARISANAVNKAVQVKKMIGALRDLRDDSGIPLVVGRSPVLTERAINEAIAKAGDDLGATRQAQELWAEFEQQRATKDYVTINHPSLLGMKVHRDLAGPMKMLFDTSDPQSLTNAVYKMSMAHKSLLFSLSLFHASTLAAVHAPMAMGRAMAQAAAGMRPSVWKYIPTAWEANAGKTMSPVAARMIEMGTTLGHGIQDVDPSFMQRVFNFVQNQVGEVPGVGKYLAGTVGVPKYLHHQIAEFIFAKVQPTFKMATWMAEDALYRKKNPNATPAQLEKAHREISDGVNVLYGGLNWFELANNVDTRIARSLAMMLFNPAGRKFQQIALLAPDWNIAAVRAWTEGAKAFNPMMSAKASDGLYRTYLVASGLVYLGMAEALQQHYTGQHIWEQDDWTFVDRGDGTKIQLNKHFMEAVHLIHDPSRFVLGKMGYIPSQIAEQLAGAEYVTHKDGKFIAPAMKDGRLWHAVKRFFTPISINALTNPEQFVAGNLGMQIGGKSFEDAARARIEKQKQKDAMSPEEKDAAKEQAAKRAKDRAAYMNKVREAERRLLH